MAIISSSTTQSLFDIIKSVKRDLRGEEKFVVIRDNAILLRIIENNERYVVMTPTARDDKGGYELYQDPELLMEIAKTVANYCDLDQGLKEDCKGRNYIEVQACQYISDAYRYAEKFVEILLSKGHHRSVHNEMKYLYDDLCFDDGEPVYLSDGMWLYPDGSMSER
jgi:hypothetical protein